MATNAYIGFDMKKWQAPDMKWHRRAQDLIAQNALTNSKRVECFVKGVYPTHLTKGDGCIVWDTEGRQYVDFICGMGTNILGYGNVEVASAVYRRMINGATLSLSTDVELECAEKVKEIFPFVEKVKFLKTGSDACTASLRIARSLTGRKKVLSEGYHGWHDEFVSLTPPALGVMNHHHIEKFTEAIDGRDVAAVIIEPIMTDMSEKRIEWIKALRELCTKTGTVLIFDEIITGFRFPKFSFSNYYNITPDILLLGKAMGNGMPISCVAGKKEVLDCGEYFVSGTFNGETCSLAAATKTMELLQKKMPMDDLWSKGERFQKEFNRIWPAKIQIEGYPTRGVFTGDPLTKALVWQEAAKAGLLFGSSVFINFCHPPLLDLVISTVKSIVSKIETGAVELQGEMPASPFAQKMRESK